MQIEVTCIRCKKVYQIILSDKGYKRWQGGEFIQDALPELSADERELLMSSICGPCFDQLFGGSDA